VHAYLLAGGLSTRFGSDKAMHMIDGVPMIVRVAATLATAGLHPVVVARERRPIDIEQLLEPDGPRHPLWGVAHALRHARRNGATRVLVCPCDLSTLSVAHVRTLLAACATAPGRAKGQPLLAVLDVAMHEAIEGGALAAAATHDILAVLPEVDLGELENLNRPRR
jgi:molybdopterin-guanine dinucleotide biosynthesis protein A